MVKKTSLFKTIGTIVTASVLALSVAGGAVVGRLLKRNEGNQSQQGSEGQGSSNSNQGYAAKSIDRVEKTNTYGLIDEYTIFYTDDTTSIFIVANGEQGPSIQCFPGSDGHTPNIRIGENGNWVVDDVDSGSVADTSGGQGEQGPAGFTPYIGDNGNWWIGETDTGVQAQGKNGEDGYIPLIGQNGNWWIGGTDTGVSAQARSIESIEKTESQGLIDVYTIKYTDGTTSTFLVTNGADGAQGQGVPGQGGYVPEITIQDGKWVIDGVQTEYPAVGPQGPQGPAGTSVQTGNGNPTTNNVEGNIGDTYIDLSTGNVYQMGQDGWGEPVSQSGLATPHIGANGNWWVGETDTGVSATGPEGLNGASLKTGNVEPAIDLGNDGDSYINTQTWDFYIKEDGAWVLKGNFAGNPGVNGVSIVSVEKTNTEGLVDTYTITYSDNTNENPHVDTFTVTNGKDGNKTIIGTGAPTNETVAEVGDSYIDVETWTYYVLTDEEWSNKGSFKGNDGVSVESILLKESNGLMDVYEITYSDNTTENPHVDIFTVTNGKDGTSLKTGHRDPRAVEDDPSTPENETLAAVEGIEGDSYVDLDTWNYFVLYDDGEGNLVWTPEGNLHYSPNRYTVTFNSNGGSDVDSYNEALEGFTIAVPTAPTQEGYFFQGWYTEEGTRWDFSKDVVTKDTTLIARWGQFVVQDGVLTDCSISEGDVVIPEYYNGQVVIGIGDEAFKGDTGVTSYLIPQTVTSIGNSAFEGCTGLTSVIIPSNVKTIGTDAFKGCSNIVYVYIEDGAANPNISTIRNAPQSKGLETIGAGAFEGCSSLRGVVIPNSVKSIGQDTLKGCDALESLTVPFIGGSATENQYFSYIFGGADYNDNGTLVPSLLKNLVITGDADIKEYALSECEHLENVAIKGNPTSVGKYAFNNCTSLVSVNLPEQLTIIEEGTFNNCSSLLSVNIPESVTAIVDHAFNNCSSITELVLPATLQSVGLAAFKGCDGLKSLTTPLLGAKTTAFSGALICGELADGEAPDASLGNENEIYIDTANAKVYRKLNGEWHYQFTIYKQNTETPATIYSGENSPTSSLGAVGDFYFSTSTGKYWVKKSSSWWGNSIEFYPCFSTLGYWFFDADGVSTFDGFDAYAPTSIESLVINNDEATLAKGCLKGTQLVSLKVPFVGGSATENKYLAYLFGAAGYYQYTFVPSTLKNLEITGDYTIGSQAVYQVESLENLIISGNPVSIEYEAFGNCHGLKNVVFSGNPGSFGGSIFYYCTNVKTIVMPLLKSMSNIFGNSVSSNVFDTIIITKASGDNNDEIIDNAFQYVHVKKLVLPDGITKIGDNAFYSTQLLKEFYIPETVTSIGNSAFYNCEMESIILPNGLTTIGNSAFSQCNNLRSVVIPDSVTTIGTNVFRLSLNLQYVKFGSGITEIKEYTFQGCANLDSVIVSENVTKICQGAFYNSGLKSFILPRYLETIEDQAFSSCSNLQAVNYSANFSSTPLTTIGREAFCYCGSLYYIGLRNASNLETIGYEAFGYCRALQSIYLGGRLTEIPEYCCQYCDSLSAIEIGWSVKKISQGAFNYCKALTFVNYWNVEEIGQNAFSDCYALAYVYGGDYYHTYSLTKIGYGAFYRCPIQALVIPNSVTYIGTHAFCYNYEIKTLSVPFVGESRDNPSDNGLTYFFGYDDCLALLQSVTITDAPSLGNYTFRNCKNLTSVVINDSCETMGSLSFYNCNKLQYLTLPKNLKSIGEYAFEYCYNLQYINLPSTLEFIPRYCFEYCYALKEVKLPDNCERIEEYAFEYSGVEKVICGSGLKTIGHSAFYNPEGYRNLKTIVLNEGLETIEEYALEYTQIESIVIPKTVKTIDNMAFYGCEKLTYIYISEGVLEIGYSAFQNTAIKSIVIPNSVTSIGHSSFQYCDNLETISIPFVGQKIEIDSQYLSNNQLQSVFDRRKIKTVVVTGDYNIAREAFADCTALETIAITGNPPTIGASAFYGCLSLKNLILPYVGGSSSFNFISGTDYPNGYAWLMTAIGNIHPYSVPNVILEDTYTGNYDDLPDGTITVSISYGGAYQLTKVFDHTQISRPDYTGDAYALPRIVGDGYWYIGNTKTSCLAPDGQIEGFWGGDPYDNSDGSGILDPNYTFTEDEDPWWPYIDEATLDVYFVQNFNDPDSSNWTWVKGGNLKTNTADTRTTLIMYAHPFDDPDYVDSLEIGTIVVDIDNQEVYQIVQAPEGSAGSKQLGAYVGDPIVFPRLNYSWYIGDTDTGITALGYLQTVFIEGNPNDIDEANPTQDSSFAGLAVIDTNTLDVYFVSDVNNAQSTWTWVKGGSIKKDPTANIIIYEAYGNDNPQDFFDDDSNLEAFPDGTIVLSLYQNPGQAFQIVKEDIYTNNWEQYTGDTGYLIPHQGDNGNWWFGDIDTGYKSYYGSYSTDSDTLSYDPNEIGYGYLDLNTFDFYVSIDTIPDGTIFINTNTGNIERYISSNWYLEDNIGSHVMTGTVNPDDADGENGYKYVNTVTGDVFVKNSGSWVKNGSTSNIKHFFGRMNYYYMVFGGNSYWVPNVLKNVTITGDNDICEGAFEGCEYLETITLSGNPQNIGKNAFKDCLSLQYFNIPESVTTIGDSAFENCPLQSINLGGNLKSIGKNAFANCSGWTLVDKKTGRGAPIMAQNTKIGDFYVDLSNGLLYYKTPDDWYQGKGYWSSAITSLNNFYSGEGYFNFYSDGQRDDGKKTLCVVVDGNLINTGLEVYYRYGAPVDGDNYDNCKWYYDSDEREFYIFQNNSWVKGSLNHISTGSGAPTASGNEDDYYIDTNTNTLYYCAGGTTWNVVMSGISVFSGYSSARDYDMEPLEGEIYIDLDTNKLYEFKNNQWMLMNVNMTIEHSSNNPVDLHVNAENGDYYFSTNGANLYKKSSNGLSVIAIGENLKNIGDGAFRDNRGLITFAIPDTVTYIGFGALEGCTSLKEIAIPYLGSGLGLTYAYGNAAPTSETDAKVFFDMNNKTLWYLVDGQWEEMDASALGIDAVLAGEYGAGEPTSTTANIGDYYVDYETGLWYEFIDTNVWNCAGELSMFYTFGASHFAYIFGNEACDDFDTYVSKVPESLKTVIIASGTRYGSWYCIDQFAFAMCSNIETIVLPDNLVFISLSAFAMCKSLKSISLPNTLENISNMAFTGCSSLESIVIPDSVYDIYGDAFSDCSSLTYVKLPANSEYKCIRDHLFSGCISLKSIVIPNSVEEIQTSAFENCVSLESLTIPNSVTKMEDQILNGCINLKYLSTPFIDGSRYEPAFLANTYDMGLYSRDPLDSDNCKHFYNTYTGDIFFRFEDGWKLAYHNENITNVISGMPQNLDLPEGSQPVGTMYIYSRLGYGTSMRILTAEGWTDPMVVRYSFLGSMFGGGDNSAVPSSLKNVTITGEYRGLYSFAFAGCTSLETVTLLSSLETIDYGMFYGCKSLKNVNFADNTKSIGQYAFQGCTSLNSIVIPNTVEAIGTSAFQGCNTLESITLPFIGDGATSTHFGYIFGAANTEGQNYYVPVSLKSVTIMGGGDIADKAFMNCVNISSITLPTSGVSSIGDRAFYNCSSLLTIKIPHGVTTIYDYAFAYCSRLSTVIMPDTIASIASHVFGGCSVNMVIYCEGSESSASVTVIKAAIGTSETRFYFYEFTEAYQG